MLITDSRHARIIEVTQDGHIVFKYSTDLAAASNPNPLSTNAVRTADGDTIIADQLNHRAITISSHEQLEFQYGATTVPGQGPNQLYGPYTAFRIGDSTGQAPPPMIF